VKNLIIVAVNGLFLVTCSVPLGFVRQEAALELPEIWCGKSPKFSGWSCGAPSIGTIGVILPNHLHSRPINKGICIGNITRSNKTRNYLARKGRQWLDPACSLEGRGLFYREIEGGHQNACVRAGK